MGFNIPKITIPNIQTVNKLGAEVVKEISKPVPNPVNSSVSNSVSNSVINSGSKSVTNTAPNPGTPVVTNKSKSSSNIFDQIGSEIYKGVTKTAPNIITNSVIDSLPPINEILEQLFEKFLSEYKLSKNMGIAVIVISISTLIIVPNLIVSFYSKYLNINLFYTYLIITMLCGSSLLSFELEQKFRDSVLYTTGIIGSIITAFTIILVLIYYFLK